MGKTTVEIRQLAENNGGTSIAPITVPEAVIYEDGASIKDKIDTLNNLSVNLDQKNNWNIIYLPNNYVIMTIVYNFTQSHYASFDGYNYFCDVIFPFELTDTNYSVFHQPVVSNGHALPSTVLNRTTTQCRVYCAASSNGSQSIRWDVLVIGKKK